MELAPYRELELIGWGAQGVVYRGRAPDGATVAVKLLSSQAPDAAERFRREAELQRELGAERGFVPILDLGRAPDGPYLVMPFLPGGTLQTRLRAGALDVDDVAALGLALARALGHAHARGIVHRDLKPGNVLFADDGRPLIADLGLAKQHSQPGVSQGLSRTGEARGTFGYMAPEQIHDAKSAGPAADVFALGAILYECLTGQPAFDGEGPIQVVAAMEGGPVPLSERRPDAPSWLTGLIGEMLRHDAAARPPDGEAVARLLAARGPGPSPRRAWLALPALGALLLAAAGAWRAGRPPEPGPTTVTATSAPTPTARTARTADRGAQVASLLRQARDHRKRGELRRALAAATRAVELDPASVEARLTRGRLHLFAGEPTEAEADLQRARELAPTSALAMALWGKALLNLDPDAADVPRACRRALALDRRCGEALLLAAELHFKGGELRAACDAASKALAYAPRLVDALRVRGMARYYLGERSAGMSDLRTAVRIDPVDGHVWHMLGFFSWREGKVEAAVRYLTRAIATRRPSEADYFYRGWAHRLGGELAAAEADLTRAVELGAGERDWALRAAVRLDRGDARGAAADATLALQRGKKPKWIVQALDTRRHARRELGDRRGAREDLERYVKLAPHDTRARQELEGEDE